MEEGSDYYVVRKGNTVAVYENLSDCQAQVSSSVLDAAVSVYKGRAWSKETEGYLSSWGLKNPLYTIDASDLNKDLFGPLIPCSFQDVVGSSSGSNSNLKRKSPASDIEVSGSLHIFKDMFYQHAIESGLTGQDKRHGNLTNYSNTQPSFPNQVLEADDLTQSIEAPAASNANNALCILNFDGGAKGNPGKGGAGALLKTEDGRVVQINTFAKIGLCALRVKNAISILCSLICRLSEGLGVVTNNVAEYKALLLGLRYALRKGFKRIDVRGDSMLVVMQVQGKWKVKHKDMIELCKKVTEVKKRFTYFNIQHVRREFNSDADHQANLAIDLRGNPGKAGAGALLMNDDGRVICRLSEGLGVLTNNVAKYKALLLGLRYKGFKRINVFGDSMLVVMQVQGKWKVEHKDMTELCKEVNKVKKRFTNFNIQHVTREFNSDADYLANMAINLRDGEVSEEIGDWC